MTYWKNILEIQLKTMSISNKFQAFCENLYISDENVASIKYRYERITRQLNADFYNIDSKVQRIFRFMERIIAKYD